MLVSEATGHSTGRGRQWMVPMQPRRSDEEHRAATPLELLFDLVFVVAVARASAGLHHAIAETHVDEGLVSYGMVFFGIWWAWMNFTWFATEYDTDDIAYRLVVFVQLVGALILAAGVPGAFDERDFTLTVIGYVVMRLALVAQWLRAARSDRAGRHRAYRFAIGVSACQVGWTALALVPHDWWVEGFLVLALAELLVPVWAERTAEPAWHVGHITERYGLFTIIVLGESILAASTAIQSDVEEFDLTSELTAIIAGGLLIVLTLWWLYFDWSADELLMERVLSNSIIWGYGHLLIFAAVAAVGAGISVDIDHATHRAEIGSFGAGAAVAVPVAVFLICLWILHEHPWSSRRPQDLRVPMVAILIFLTPLTGQAVLLTGILMAALLASRLTLARPRTVEP